MLAPKFDDDGVDHEDQNDIELGMELLQFILIVKKKQKFYAC